MTDVYDEALRRLRDAQFDVSTTDDTAQAFVFENDTVLGFGFVYSTPAELISRWATDADQLIAVRRFQLRKAATKAWNTYVLFLAAARPTPIEAVALSLIEEDLAGYRKIARAGCSEQIDLNRALLPLLPIQSAPVLEAVDSKSEIRQRASDVPSKLMDAFLSEADEQIVLQMLEQEA